MRYYWGIKNTVTNEYFSYKRFESNVFSKDIMYSQFFTSKEDAENIIKLHNYKNCKPVKIKAIYEECKE